MHVTFIACACISHITRITHVHVSHYVTHITHRLYYVLHMYHTSMYMYHTCTYINHTCTCVHMYQTSITHVSQCMHAHNNYAGRKADQPPLSDMHTLGEEPACGPSPSPLAHPAPGSPMCCSVSFFLIAFSSHSRHLTCTGRQARAQGQDSTPFLPPSLPLPPSSPVHCRLHDA